MGLTGFVFTLVLLLANLLASIRLTNRLAQNVQAELLLLVVGVCLWFIALLGLALHKRWGWKWNLVLFSLSLGNLVWVYSMQGVSATLASALFVNAFGWLVSVLGIDLYIPEDNANDTANSELKELDVEEPKKRKARSKK